MNGECLNATQDNPGRCGRCEGCYRTLHHSLDRQLGWIQAAIIGEQLQRGANFTASLKRAP